MNSLWTKGIKRGSQEAIDVRDAFNGSLAARKRLVEMLEAMQKEEIDSKISDAAYDNPSWAYKQADSVGYMRAIDRLKKVLLD